MNVITKKTATGFFAALVFAAVALFSPIAPTANAACSPTTGGVQAGIDCAKNDKVPSELFGGSTSIFTRIVNVLLFLIGVLSVIMLIYGGIRYTTSGGNSANVTAAKNTILYAIIGLVVAFLAYAVVNFVLSAVAK